VYADRDHDNNPIPAGYLLGFRGAVSMQPAAGAADAMSPYQAFAVGEPHWFRLLPIGEL